MPLALFVALAGATFALAKLHLAKPGTPAAAKGTVEVGDSYRGETLFASNCASCHGDGGRGGIAPRLAGAQITLAQAKAQIDNGGGSMPAGLVTGQKRRDVLAYVATLIAKR